MFMRNIYAFVLLSLEVAVVNAKSSVSSLEDIWSFIAVVYAAVLVPLISYFLYSIARDPTTKQVMETINSDKEATSSRLLKAVARKLMWVLDVVAGDGGGGDTTFYLVAGEWSVGRKRCHFNFQADSSISRTHALIRVGALTPEQLADPSTRPTLELVDQNSRFGSFVNEEQCFKSRSLRHGDQISFGAKKTVLRVRYQVFVLVASRIQRANRAQVNDTCQRLASGVYAVDLRHYESFEPSRAITKSMQELIAAMGGTVIAAYKDFKEDDNLLRELDSLSSKVVERRVELFKSMGAVFTSVQELAASVIFVKPPMSSNDSTFSKHDDDDVKSSKEDQDVESVEGSKHDDTDVVIKESPELQPAPSFENQG
eukprot:jgi/Phyca11/13624/fgenesh1_pg.PHYCAscaffold_4_\